MKKVHQNPPFAPISSSVDKNNDRKDQNRPIWRSIFRILRSDPTIRQKDILTRGGIDFDFHMVLEQTFTMVVK